MWTRHVARDWQAGLAIALALLITQPQASHAQVPAPRAVAGATAPAAEELILSVRANGVARGEFTLLRQPDGDFWIAGGDIERLGIAPVAAARRQVGEGAYYSLRGLGAVSLAFNEADLSLNVDFPAEQMEGTRFDLAHRLPPLAEIRPQNSLILSYRLAARGATGQPMQTTLHNDLNVRLGRLLLRQETLLRTGVPGRRFVRGVSQAVWDSTSRGTRVIAGDTISTAGRFGGTITGGGVLFSRLFELTPEIIKQPTATLQAAARLPAEVEVAVDGNTVMHARVAPGPIVLSNLQSYGGTRNVRVTVTDIAGRKEVFDQPFLFTDQVLAKGLHDYSYFAGRRSELGDEGWRYRAAAWQAVHAYGVSDSLTVAAGGEGNREFASGGVGATVRSDTLGLIASDVLASVDRLRHRAAGGWAARYAYVVPAGSLLLSHRRYSEGFRGFSTGPLRPFLRSESRVGLSTRAFGASWAADWVRSEDALEKRRSRVLRVSGNIHRQVALGAQYQSTIVNGQADWSAQVNLRIDLDGRHWVSGMARAAPKARGLDLETGRNIGAGEDFGYRAGVITDASEGADRASGYLSGTWHLRPASLEFFGSSQLRGGTAQHGEVAVSGALVAVDGYLGLTRQVSDSFVVASLGIAQPGVDILLNNQVEGKSDAQGKLFIPEVSSYGRQTLSLNDKQLGMEFSVREKRRTLTLPYRSGMVVDFGGRKVRAVTGMAWLLQAGQRRPLASATLTLTGPGGTLTPETSRVGDFYLDDAAPGRYTGPLEFGNRVYSCRVDVPQFPEPVHELKEGIVCE